MNKNIINNVVKMLFKLWTPDVSRAPGAGALDMASGEIVLFR